MRSKRTVVVTESAVQAALRRGPAAGLGAEEEKAMRMRLGASLPRGAALERKALPGSEAELELLAFEVEAYLKVRGRTPRGPQVRGAKAKIVRALRRRG